jgi:1-acyl-sn-glycerol-3-phosphate acyltransferase
MVPVGLIGTDQVQAPDQRLPRVGKEVTVRFGSTLRVVPQEANQRAHLRDVTDRMMADISALCGQQYVDRNAELVRAGP